MQAAARYKAAEYVSCLPGRCCLAMSDPTQQLRYVNPAADPRQARNRRAPISEPRTRTARSKETCCRTDLETPTVLVSCCSGYRDCLLDWCGAGRASPGRSEAIIPPGWALGRLVSDRTNYHHQLNQLFGISPLSQRTARYVGRRNQHSAVLC